MTDPILIVEDEIKIAELLRDYCEDAGLPAVMLHDGDEALAWLAKHRARVVLLDLMLPGADGFSICQSIRKVSEVPVIMITARVEEIDRLLGLGFGADDYICKPFSPREVIARIRVILRRVEKSNRPLSSTEIKIDASSLRVSVGAGLVELTLVEFKLFEILIANPGRIYSRAQLKSSIYDDYRVVTDRTIDSHIKKLRQKLITLELENDPIHSVYGVGYKFES